MPTFADGCAAVSASLAALDGAGTRMALDPLGVEVNIWREDFTDGQWNPLPRRSPPMTPFDPGILYGYTHRAPRD